MEQKINSHREISRRRGWYACYGNGIESIEDQMLDAERWERGESLRRSFCRGTIVETALSRVNYSLAT